MLSPVIIISLIVAYFLVLIGISYFTSRGAGNSTFFIGDRNSKWYLVAFGMIGTSLSGITFISIPGTVGDGAFSYMQIVIGYMFGYFVIATVLMPLYYRMNLTSIYTYLGNRYGQIAYMTGTIFFFISRMIGAALRMYVVAMVLQAFVFDDLGVSFEVTVAISIALIWLYTQKGGIKTIVWTDTLQTLFMLIALFLSIFLLKDALGMDWSGVYNNMKEQGWGQWFFTDDVNATNYVWKQILAGFAIAVCMTGLDQDMMQKNLSCPNIKDAQKNMFSFSVILFIVNFFFLFLGVLLMMYLNQSPDLLAEWNTMFEGGTPEMDKLFPFIALEGGLGIAIGIFFLLGLIAAAYSSADSALTALTTSFCVDILKIEKKEEKQQVKTRRLVHILLSVVLLFVVIIFNTVKQDSLIWELFKFAGYTYGPLMGLFFFGIIMKRKVNDFYIPFIAILAPIITYVIQSGLAANPDGFQLGSELILVNGGLTFLGLLLSSKPNQKNASTGILDKSR